MAGAPAFLAVGFRSIHVSHPQDYLVVLYELRPEIVIEEDEQLQMMHDMAELRAQG